MPIGVMMCTVICIAIDAITSPLSGLFCIFSVICCELDYNKRKAKSPTLAREACLLNWEPGGELLSHSECYTTIVAAAFHF